MLGVLQLGVHWCSLGSLAAARQCYGTRTWSELGEGLDVEHRLRGAAAWRLLVLLADEHRAARQHPVGSTRHAGYSRAAAGQLNPTDGDQKRTAMCQVSMGLGRRGTGRSQLFHIAIVALRLQWRLSTSRRLDRMGSVRTFVVHRFPPAAGSCHFKFLFERMR